MASLNRRHCILFPSRLPDELSATFPPVLLKPDVTVIRIPPGEWPEEDLKLSGYGQSHFFNPPLSTVQRLPGDSSITLSFDTLPAEEMSAGLAPYRVQVPSLAFRSAFRGRGVSAETVNPVPAGTPHPEKIRSKVRKRYQLLRKFLLWVDDRFLIPGYRSSVFQTLQRVMREFPVLQVLWVTKYLKTPPKGMMIVDPKKVKDQKLWLAADLLLTIGSVKHSLVPLHLQALSLGIPVMTAEGGDHAEWVNHLFSGIVLNRKNIQEELRAYLNQLLKNPGLIKQFRANGRQLANCITEMRRDG